MVENQSCAGLVNASALHGIEQQVNHGDSLNIIAEISAELQRERQKNAELMETISVLEAQIKERDMVSLVTDGNGCCHNATERKFKKSKRQKTEPSGIEIEDGTVSKRIEMDLQTKHDTRCRPQKKSNPKDRLVNWMSMDETQLLLSGTFEDGGFGADYNDTDDTDDDYYDYEDDDIDIDQRDVGIGENLRASNGFKEHLHKEHLHEESVNKDMHTPCLDGSSGGQSEPTPLNVTRETDEDEKTDCLLANTIPFNTKNKLKNLVRKENKRNGDSNAQLKKVISGQEISHKGCGSLSLHKKPSKIAFCPKEVQRIIESKALPLKNAQSHTIRKIIVFASLGIWHGCEDMYELDFNHFSILRKGEPFVSPSNPGEHVLYENPGVRRKIFYPNRQNPTLCPVQILEEEKAIRPSDATCPPCLFLCIKYGGRTRNIPQNEYVRQRMGRNKLKSFGSVMCWMAMLLHIRSGSFFFKALGITLLFMAGFPDNVVQGETKYRNLALLQKYYRSDEDAEGEELFLPHPVNCDIQSSPKVQRVTGKANSRKLKSKKQLKAAKSLQKSSIVQSASPSSTRPTQFGLMGYASLHTNSVAAFQSMSSQTLADTPPISNPLITSCSPNINYLNQRPYFSLPPQPTNAFMTMMYYPPPNTYPPCHFPSSYGYLPSTVNYTPIHPQTYFSHPSCSFYVPKIVEDSGKNDVADSDSDSSSSSTEPREVLTSSQQ